MDDTLTSDPRRLRRLHVAAGAVVHAWTDERWPAHHGDQVRRLRNGWPSLSRPLDNLTEALRDLGKDPGPAVDRGVTAAGVPASSVTLVAAEVHRARTEEGYTPETDADLADGELAWAGWAYLDRAARDASGTTDPPTLWPWPRERWKPDKSPLRMLIVAAALICHEIDRRLAKGERP